MSSGFRQRPPGTNLQYPPVSPPSGATSNYPQHYPQQVSQPPPRTQFLAHGQPVVGPPLVVSPNSPQSTFSQGNPQQVLMPPPHQMSLNQTPLLQQPLVHAAQPTYVQNTFPCTSGPQLVYSQPVVPDPPANYFQLMKPEESMGETWKDELKEELDSPYFAKRLATFLEKEPKGGVYPRPEDVFNWTKHCDIDKVKVVIVGQDPYPGTLSPEDGGDCKANGLAFSIKKPGKANGSLRNIFDVLKKNCSEFRVPEHGDLTGWAEQGVVLLNAVLTVRAEKAGSHKRKGWETFTDAVIERISFLNDRVVFMLWGEVAQEKKVWIDEGKHRVLTSCHPSARLMQNTAKPFSECKHFVEANNILRGEGNEFLCENEKEEIDWNDL